MKVQYKCVKYFETMSQYRYAGRGAMAIRWFLLNLFAGFLLN